MTFLFIGLDSFDKNLCKEFNISEQLEDTPVDLKKLEQDLPEVISEKGESENNTGHWTFYVWGAIASGQIETPEMRQEHPLPGQVEYPLKLKYLLHAPKSILRYVEGRLKRRQRYKSFVWDSFENVKVINFPIHMPEYNENAELVRDDTTSRDYGPMELNLLKTEINNALRKNYDAVFVVTRMVDCKCHGATSPLNYDSESLDEWMQETVGRSFEDVHESGMDMSRFAEEEDLDVDQQHKQDADMIKQQVLDHVEDAYGEAVDLLKTVDWDKVDEHVVVSDHGFEALGAGSVNAHGKNAVLSCSFGYWRKMSAFIENWRPALQENFESSGETEEKSKEEKVKDELEKLGYNT